MAPSRLVPGVEREEKEPSPPLVLLLPLHLLPLPLPLLPSKLARRALRVNMS